MNTTSKAVVAALVALLAVGSFLGFLNTNDYVKRSELEEIKKMLAAFPQQHGTSAPKENEQTDTGSLESSNEPSLRQGSSRKHQRQLWIFDRWLGDRSGNSEKIAALEANLASLQATVDNLTTEGLANAAIAINSFLIAGMQGTVDTLTSDVAMANATMSSNLDSIAALKLTVDSLTNSTTIPSGTDSIAALALKVDGLRSDVATVNSTITNDLDALESKIGCIRDGDSTDDLYFEGCNVHVLSGAGSTGAPVNGKGNLIVGYDEESATSWAPIVCSTLFAFDQTSCERLGGIWAQNQKLGSHNIVLGNGHSYTQFGGIVAGSDNAISGAYASVTGGEYNSASSQYSSVSGGIRNTASADYSSVTAGQLNTASEVGASVTGGDVNTASGYFSSVTGGTHNTANGDSASVTGGNANTARAFYASVTGGQNNTANGQYSSVTGGNAITANDNHDNLP